MKYEIAIVSLPAKEYLAIKGYMSFDKITMHDEWARRFGFPNESLTEQLKQKSGATKVYRLFCNSCVKDDQFGWVCGSDIACENINNAPPGDGLEIIRLGASEYIKTGYSYPSSMTSEQAFKELDDYFWNEWLKNNPYKSKIEGEFANMPGTACIELFDDANRVVTIWQPICRDAS